MAHFKSIIFVALAILLVLGSAAFICLRPGSPPSVSIALLGYTNGIGPHALLAITNCSKSAITLDSTCLVNYSPTQYVHSAAPRRITSIDAYPLSVTRLNPNEGFVQSVFIFPAGSKSDWQLECHAAYSSGWLETRRSAERWLRKHFRRVRFPFTSKAWTKFRTEWEPCPP